MRKEDNIGIAKSKEGRYVNKQFIVLKSTNKSRCITAPEPVAYEAN